MIPPRRLNIAGPGDFRKVGTRWVETMRLTAGLTKTARVLDIGCGIGRIAVGLTDYLSSPGSYRGFDVIPFATEWCRKEISSRFPKFAFDHVDVHNDSYNPNGRMSPTDFRFPYPDGEFDFIIATSLFTHLLPESVERYLSEIARVGRPRAKVFSTWYLQGDQLPLTPASRLRFPADRGDYALASERTPTAAVRYSMKWVSMEMSRWGLALDGVVPGAWRGVDGRHSQDLVLASVLADVT